MLQEQLHQLHGGYLSLIVSTCNVKCTDTTDFGYSLCIDMSIRLRGGRQILSL